MHVSLQLYLFGLLLLAAAPAAAQPYEVASWSEGNLVLPGKGLPFNVAFHVPVSKDKKKLRTPINAPVLVWITGFSGLCPQAFYSTFFNRIASQGVVVIGLERFRLIDAKKQARELPTVVSWLKENVNQKYMKKHKAPNTLPDFEHLAMGSHSSSAHVLVNYLSLKAGCDAVKAAVLMNPVDGVDPFGYFKDFAIVPPAPVNFTVPALHIACGLDPVPARKFFPPCAPADLSNERFFGAWRGPIWQVDALDMGHADILNQGVNNLAMTLCSIGQLGKEEKQNWRILAADLVYDFMRGVFSNETDAIARLEKAGSVGTDNGVRVGGKFSRNGLGDAELRGGCRLDVETLELESEAFELGDELALE